MTLTVTHRFVSQVPPTDDDNLVKTTYWNEDHVIVGTLDPSQISPIAANTLLANPTGAPASPIATTLGATLAFVGGTSLQTTALTGDVAASANSFVTTIQPAAVTYAKIQNVAANRLLGNPTSGAASTSEISLGATLTFSVTALQTLAMSGDVASSANSFATTIQPNVVDNTKFRQGVARSVVGVTGNATANIADIQGTANQVLVVNSAGSALAFGQVNLSSASAITGSLPLGNIAAIANNTLLGNSSGSSAAPAAQTLGATLAFSAGALQTVAQTGDVTTSANSFVTTIAAAAVTYAKIQNVAASRLLGNPTGSPASASEISLGAALTFSGSALQTVAFTGDMTTSANSVATTVGKVNGVSYPASPAIGSVPSVTSSNTVTYTITPTLGVANTSKGTLALAHNANTGVVTIAPAPSATSWTLVLPVNGGTNLFVLQTDGSGGTSWVAAGSGTVTSVATGAGLTGGAITTTGTLKIDPVYLRGYIAGLVLSTAGSSSTFTTAAGVATDSTQADLMSLGSSLAKTTSAWAVGAANGSLDTGAIANTTWYHVWLIKRSDTGVVDVLTSLSATAPTMPTNYDRKRRIGAMLTDGSSKWTLFHQFGDEFLWDVMIEDVAVSTQSTSAVSRVLSVPTGVQVIARTRVRSVNAASNVGLLLSALDESDQAVSGSKFTIFNPVANLSVANNTDVRTDTSAQVRTRATAASTSVTIVTYGWFDYRGKYD